jgi:hypothetical protein
MGTSFTQDIIFFHQRHLRYKYTLFPPLREAPLAVTPRFIVCKMASSACVLQGLKKYGIWEGAKSGMYGA